MTTRQKIQTLLAKRGWNPHRLAVESKVPYSTVLEYISGKRDTSTANADAMLAALQTKEQR